MKATLFADGGSRGNPGPAASGAVLLDERGEVLREVGTYLGRTTNNVAEWTGLLTGLEAALELGVSELDVRLDSELVVRQISGAYRVKHENLIPLYQKARGLLRALQARLDRPRPAQREQAGRRARQPHPRRASRGPGVTL